MTWAVRLHSDRTFLQPGLRSQTCLNIFTSYSTQTIDTLITSINYTKKKNVKAHINILNVIIAINPENKKNDQSIIVKYRKYWEKSAIKIVKINTPWTIYNLPKTFYMGYLPGKIFAGRCQHRRTKLARLHYNWTDQTTTKQTTNRETIHSIDNEQKDIGLIKIHGSLW